MNESKLVRGISRWDLVAITINLIIGAGIFGLPSKVAALIGNYSLFAFVACGIIIAFIVLCFAEVSSRFEATGGMYLYAKEAFGSVVGFEVGWLYWIVRITTFAANCNLLLSYLGFFYPTANQGSTRIVLILLVLTVITIVNFLGVRQSAIFTNIFTVGKIVPLTIFVVVGMFYIQPENFTFAAAAPDNSAFASAVLLLIYAFVGFEAAVIPAGEVRDPQRSVPFALLTALAVIVVLYIAIQIVSIGTLPGLAQSERPLADAANNFLGIYGAAFITVGAIISILGNLNGGFLPASRIPFAMAEQKELPQVLSATHSKFQTPYVSLFLTSIVILVFTVQSSFVSALTIATITRLIVYATTCAALPIFRHKDNANKAKFTVPLGNLASILSISLVGWLLWNVELKEFRTVFLILVTARIVFFTYQFFGNKNKDSSFVASEN